MGVAKRGAQVTILQELVFFPVFFFCVPHILITDSLVRAGVINIIAL